MQLLRRKHIIPPCSKCPYTLGQVHTLVSPCPCCRSEGYATYDVFVASVGLTPQMRFPRHGDAL